MNVTKQDVYIAFQQRRRKRNRLLYEHYRELFALDVTADYLAQKISLDLDFPISPGIIYKIRHRILKQENQPPPTRSLASIGYSKDAVGAEHSTVPEGKKRGEERAEKYGFKNADEYTGQDALDKAFEDL